MKLHYLKKSIYASLFLSVLTAPVFAVANMTIAGPTSINTPGKFYFGAFGGSGSTKSIDVSQFGTAFYFEASGGPLAVNAFGDTNDRTAGLFGLQTGYQAPAILLNSRSQWGLVPAIEMEGFYFENANLTGHLTNDEATRLPEHDFVVTYGMKRRVFLANAVFNFNVPNYKFHPYVGVGFGGAMVRLSGSTATQVAPPEPGVNHYNSSTSDTDPTFAGQVKAGISYDINDCFSLFAEYRWLYVGNTHFTFGSTIYTGHPVTSSWQVKLDSQTSNIGTVGIRAYLY